MGAHKGEAQLRLTRAIAAGLASSGSMGAAAICVLIIGSATIAWDDWPGALRDSGRGVATVAPLPESPSSASPRPAAALPRRFPAPPRLRALRAGSERLIERTRNRRRGTARTGRRGLAPASTAPPAPATSPPPPAPPPARPLHDTAVAAAGTVRATGRTVGGEIGKINGPAGRQVVAATDTVAATIEELADLLP